MQITRISLNKDITQRDGNRLIAFGSIDLDKELRIEFIRVIKTHDGRILICMPSIVNRAGVHKDTVHPLCSELRRDINEMFLEELTKI